MAWLKKNKQEVKAEPIIEELDQQEEKSEPAKVKVSPEQEKEESAAWQIRQVTTQTAPIIVNSKTGEQFADPLEVIVKILNILEE